MVGSTLDESIPMVPRIRQVQIQNYKSIERAVIDLEPFTVFVGANGSGKSNFVDALAFVQECLNQSVKWAFDRRGGFTIVNRGCKEPASIGFRFLIDLSEESSADYSFTIHAEDFHVRVTHEHCTVLGEGGKESGFETSEGRFLREIPGVRSKLLPDRLALFAASAVEEFRPLYEFLTLVRPFSIDPNRLRGQQRLESGEVLQQDGGNAASVLNHLLLSSQETYGQICRLLGSLIPGIEKIEVLTDAAGREGTIAFQQNIGEETTSFLASEMSDGTLRALGLLLALHQPQHPTVILVEEPEATIHPAMIELVVQVLVGASWNCQILVTTHSPEILDAEEIQDDQIRVVTLENGKTVIAPLSKASRQAVRENLYTPGELLRIDELHQDLEAALEASENLDISGKGPRVTPA